MLKFCYVIPFLALSYIYMKNVMHMFQQNRYEYYRYTKWLFSFKTFHFIEALIYCLLMVGTVFIPSLYLSHIVVVAITILFAIIMINNESKDEYIKPLVYTPRVKRTYVIYYIVQILFILALLTIFHKHLGLVGIFVILGSYLTIYIAALIISPI